MRIAADFVIEHASLVATCAGPAPRRGAAQGDITPIHDASIAAHQGVIVYVGPRDRLHASVQIRTNATRVDATGCTVVPGFVDPHTHVVFAGDRRHELQRRLAGASYADIPVDQAVTDGKLVTAPAWPAHAAWLAQFLVVLGTRVEA